MWPAAEAPAEVALAAEALAAEAPAEVPPHQSQQEDTVTRPGVFSQESVT